MENIFDVNEFAIQELETIEAPLTDYQAGFILGSVIAIDIAGTAAICAC